MGWTSFQSMPRGGMVAAVIASLTWKNEAEGIESSVLKAKAVGGNVYAAVQFKRGDEIKVEAYVGIIDGLAYKLISEQCGPYYWDCPAEILALLSPTESVWAQTWRAKCAEVV